MWAIFFSGNVGEKKVTQTANPYPGLPVEIFAIANLNGTVWSCNSCNIRNITQANQLIAQQNKAEAISDAVSAVNSAVSELRSGIESYKSNLESGLQSMLSSLQSAITSSL